MVRPSDLRLVRVWLIGSMGSGKTVVGQALAARLGCPLIDNDVALERERGRSAQELAGAGAEELHEAESVQLRRVVTEQAGPCVAGFAASVADRPDDVELLAQSGFVVYLRARLQTLVGRVGTGAGRPWLEGGAEAYLEGALARRAATYERWADLVVDVDDRSVADVVERVLDGLGQERGSRR